jgi:hypothetical protein
MEAPPSGRKKRSAKKAAPPPPSLTTENFQFASFRASAGITSILPAPPPPPGADAFDPTAVVSTAPAAAAAVEAPLPPFLPAPPPPIPAPPPAPSVVQQMQQRLAQLEEASAQEGISLLNKLETTASNEVEQMAEVGSEVTGAPADSSKKGVWEKVNSPFVAEDGAKEEETPMTESMERLAAWELVGAVLPTLEECTGDQAARDKAMMLKVAVARQHLRRNHHKTDAQAIEQQIQDARAATHTTAAQALAAMCDAGGGAGAARAAAPAQDNSELLQRISRLEAQHEMVRFDVARVG